MRSLASSWVFAVASALSCVCIVSQPGRASAQTEPAPAISHRFEARVGGTDHRPTGNDRWGALLQCVGTIDVGPEAAILIEGIGTLAGRAGQTEVGPFGFGLRADILDIGETTRGVSRAGFYASFPATDSPNVSLLPLLSFGIDQPWLLGPGLISLVGGGRFEQRLAGVLRFAFDGTAAFMVTPSLRDATASGVGGLEAALVLGAVSIVARVSAAFAGQLWAIAGRPRVRIDFGSFWLEASASATFAGTLPATQGGYGADLSGGLAF